MTAEEIIIMMLVTFIIGLFMGVALIRPKA
jgi:hypothetical protein